MPRRRPQGAYRRPKQSRMGTRRHVRLALLLGVAGLLIAAAVMLVSYLQQGAATRRLQAELREEQQLQAEAAGALIAQSTEAAVIPSPMETSPAQTEPPAASPSPYPLPREGAPLITGFASLMQKNPDVVGWLKSDAISYVDFPIVKRDNSYYLYRDFYGRDNLAGTVFMDADNSILPQDQNLILHGHNMKNGTMFGKLARLLDRETLVDRPFFTFSTLYESHDYVPYAVALVSLDPQSPRYFDFSQRSFSSQDSLDAYIAAGKALSAVDLPIGVEPADRLLTLVTCHGLDDNERLILGLRALRPGEDKPVIRSLLYQRAASRP